MHLSLRTQLRHGRRRGARASLLVAAPLALALAATPAQAAETTLDAYGCSSTTAPGNVFTVPSHVESLTVRATGERGGGFGGMGAVVSGRVAVSPGERLYVCVGTGGGSAGWGSGAAGADGGGLSSVSRNEFNSGAFVIAGGGGGTGGGSGGTGGDGGMLDDFGGNGGWEGISLGGGGAGSGAGGQGGRYDDDAASPLNGRGGTVSTGGNGGDGSGVGANGGGGGAGWHGGGGGSASTSGGAGGGGGGSSYCNSAQITDCASDAAAVSSPSVTFTYPDAPTPTTATLTVTPDRLVSGRDITFSTTISPIPDGGTVTITQTTFHINEACDDIPVGLDGRASCTVPASLSPGAYDIDADYSGTAAFAPSRDTKPLSVMYGTQTLPYLSGSGTPAPGDAVTYLADVIPHPLMDLGTVDFTLGGDPIAACQDVAIARGQARCDTTAPGAGRHTLGAGYNGSPMYDVSTGRSDFTIAAAAGGLTFSDATLDFGTVTIGTAPVDKLVTLTAGPAPVTITSIMTLGNPWFGSFGDTCGMTIAANASCTVAVRFAPGVEGSQTARLIVNSNAAGGPHEVTLLGRGVAAGGNPDPGTGDPRTGNPGTGDPRTGQPGTGEPRTGAPGTGEPSTDEPRRTGTPSGTASKPVTVARSAGGRASVSRSGAITIPLACPAGETCRVSGTLSVGASSRLARSAAAGQQVIARFRGVAFTAGQTRALRLRLPAAFVRQAQRSGARTVRATLTLTTVRGNGARTTTRQRITLVLPRAAAAPKPAQRPSFTG